jgi:hypothetical protein
VGPARRGRCLVGTGSVAGVTSLAGRWPHRRPGARDVPGALVAAVGDELYTPTDVRDVAEAARAAPPGADPPRVVDVVLDAFALQFTGRHAAAAPALTRALERLLARLVQ